MRQDGTDMPHAPHNHALPPAGKVIDTLRLHQAGHHDEADAVVDSYGCCRRGIAGWVAAHFVLAASLTRYANAVVVVQEPTGPARDDDTPMAQQVREVANAYLANEHRRGAALLADLLDQPDDGALRTAALHVMGVGVKVLDMALSATPGSDG